ncbi:SPFH domain-containing protein [Prosthecochloris sp.]|uniref:SPFH domain-containing protein n=1 Tax=Prosthecochloris sp. TaxID=290513 RepID=UPI0025E439B0|nr:SPFH domain-containing protein [Prosthecochloris sp.]
MLSVLFLFIVALSIVFLVKGFKIVKQSETMVIERLGSYHRTLSPGINIIWPVVDKPRTIEWRYVKSDLSGDVVIRRDSITRIDLRETLYDFPKQSVITRDNVAIEINALLYFQITDPKRAVYEIANLPDAVEKLTQTTLRNIIGELDLDNTLTSRDTINGKLKAILDEATDKWGVKVNRVELQDINPPLGVKDAMEKQMRAERDRRASILEAEGMKQAKILEAEGIRQSEINKAEGLKEAVALEATGEAEARIRVAKAEAEAVSIVTSAIKESGGNPTTYLVALKYIDAMKEMVSGKDNKVVYMPYEASSLLGSVGSIKDMFQKN